MSYGIPKGLNLECLSHADPSQCVEPTALHVVIHKDFEEVPYVEALLNGHEEAEVAAEKIREYLKDFDDEDTYVIHTLTNATLTNFVAYVDGEMIELRREKEEDVRSA